MQPPRGPQASDQTVSDSLSGVPASPQQTDPRQRSATFSSGSPTVRPPTTFCRRSLHSSPKLPSASLFSTSTWRRRDAVREQGKSSADLGNTATSGFFTPPLRHGRVASTPGDRLQEKERLNRLGCGSPLLSTYPAVARRKQAAIVRPLSQPVEQTGALAGTKAGSVVRSRSVEDSTDVDMEQMTTEKLAEDPPSSDDSSQEDKFTESPLSLPQEGVPVEKETNDSSQLEPNESAQGQCGQDESLPLPLVAADTPGQCANNECHAAKGSLSPALHRPRSRSAIEYNLAFRLCENSCEEGADATAATATTAAAAAAAAEEENQDGSAEDEDIQALSPPPPAAFADSSSDEADSSTDTLPDLPPQENIAVRSVSLEPPPPRSVVTHRSLSHGFPLTIVVTDADNQEGNNETRANCTADCILQHQAVFSASGETDCISSTKKLQSRRKVGTVVRSTLCLPGQRSRSTRRAKWLGRLNMTDSSFSDDDGEGLSQAWQQRMCAMATALRRSLPSSDDDEEKDNFNDLSVEESDNSCDESPTHHEPERDMEPSQDIQHNSQTSGNLPASFKSQFSALHQMVVSAKETASLEDLFDMFKPLSADDTTYSRLQLAECPDSGSVSDAECHQRRMSRPSSRSHLREASAKGVVGQSKDKVGDW